MQTLQDLKTELSFTKSIKTLISSKEEISIMRMRKIRNFVLESRHFTAGLSQITSDIRRSYRERLDDVAATKNLKELIELSVSVKKGAWVSVLVTPNTRLAGTIVAKVYSSFITEMLTKPFSDIVIIGSLGKELYQNSKLNKPFTYFEISEESIDQQDLAQALEFISGYARIDVYYGKLHTLITQEAVKTDITAEKLFENSLEEGKLQPEEPAKFLFEPELREIIAAMEMQFLTLFFKQVIDESNLAQLGSRISFMEEATDRIEDSIKQLDFAQKIAQKKAYNKKMQQTYAGLELWN